MVTGIRTVVIFGGSGIVLKVQEGTLQSDGNVLYFGLGSSYMSALSYILNIHTF